MSVVVSILVIVVVPLVLGEFVEWCPWLARRIIRSAARIIPFGHRGRYIAEWLAEMEALPGGKLTMVFFAIRVFLSAPGTARALGDRPLVFAAKHAIDRLTAVLALLILAPALAAMALFVRLSSRGPVLFRQIRIGKDGQEFMMVKFRSMYVDAEARIANTLATTSSDDETPPISGADPRVTHVGRFLRKFSFDELPQLINVAKGNMSLVGPRPPLPEELSAGDDQAYVRPRIKPGLTGLWQLSRKTWLSTEEARRLDEMYVDNWSLVLDLMILWKTAFTVRRSDADTTMEASQRTSRDYDTEPSDPAE